MNKINTLWIIIFFVFLFDNSLAQNTNLLWKALHKNPEALNHLIKKHSYEKDVDSLVFEEKHKNKTLAKPLISDDQFVYRFISAMDISPNFPQDKTLFVFVYNDGVYKSTDGGSSWLLYDSERRHSKNLRLAPNYPEINRLYFWDDVAFSPNFLKDSTIYAADGSTMHGGAVWISTDGGQTWEKLGNPENEVGHDSNAAYAIALSPDFPVDSSLFVGTWDGVFKSLNGGKSWIQTYGQVQFPPVYYVSCLAVSPVYKNDQTVFAGTIDGLLKSTDGGVTWYPVLFESAGRLWISPEYETDQTIFAATSGGVFFSKDGGITWQTANDGLTDLNVEAIAFSPDFETDHTIFIGTHDGVFRSTTLPIKWEPMNHGLKLHFGIKNLTKSPYRLDTVPSIASDSDENLHVVWWGTIATEDTTIGLTTDPYYIKIIDGYFGDPERIIVPDKYLSMDVSLAVDPHNHVHLAFNRFENFNHSLDEDIYYTNNVNGSFQQPLLMAQGVMPALAVDRQGNAHIVYENYSEKYYDHISYKNYIGGSFNEPVIITDKSHYLLGTRPNIITDDSLNAHIVFNSGFSNDPFREYDVFYAKVKTDSLIKIVDTTNQTDIGADWGIIALDSFNNPHIAYGAQFGELWYTNAVADSFQAPIRISYVGGGKPKAITVDKNNRVHIGGGGSYYNNVSGAFSGYDIVKGALTPNFNSGPRSMAITKNNQVYMVFSMRSNLIETDFNYDVYLVSFTISETPSHFVYGSVQLDGVAIPPKDSLHYQAFLTSHPDDILTENAPGCGYQNGSWWVECNSFENEWSVGDTLRIEFYLNNNFIGFITGTLTAAEYDFFDSNIITGLKEPNNLVRTFELFQNYPNPFNPSTNIKYQLSQSTHVFLGVYNVLGQLVRVLVNEKEMAGNYSVIWDGKDDIGAQVASGIYFYRIQTEDFTKVKKMLFIR